MSNMAQNMKRLNKLEKFFKDVADLTVNHDVIGDEAVVFPKKLDKVLKKVDTDWYSHRGDNRES